MPRVVNNNRGFLQLLADCPAHQRKFLLRTATPQQLHPLVQVLYNIRMGHISIPKKISGYCCHIKMVTKQTKSPCTILVVLLKTYYPPLFQA